jgi:hypothetical protein
MKCSDIDISDRGQAHEEIKHRLLDEFNVQDDGTTVSAMSTVILNNHLSQ